MPHARHRFLSAWTGRRSRTRCSGSPARFRPLSGRSRQRSRFCGGPLQPHRPHRLRDTLVVVRKQPVQGLSRAADGERNSIRRQLGVDAGALDHRQSRPDRAPRPADPDRQRRTTRSAARPAPYRLLPLRQRSAAARTLTALRPMQPSCAHAPRHQSAPGHAMAAQPGEIGTQHLLHATPRQHDSAGHGSRRTRPAIRPACSHRPDSPAARATQVVG